METLTGGIVHEPEALKQRCAGAEGRTVQITVPTVKVRMEETIEPGSVRFMM